MKFRIHNASLTAFSSSFRANMSKDRRGGVPFFVPSAHPPKSRHCSCTYIVMILLYTRSAPQTNNYVSNIIRINYYRVQKGDFRITPVYKIMIIIIIIYAHSIASVRGGSYNLPSSTRKIRVYIYIIYHAHTRVYCRYIMCIAVHVDELIVLDL